PDAGAHTFDLYLVTDGLQQDEVVLAAAREIVANEKPAHTVANVILVRPAARADLQAIVGVDLVLGRPEDPEFTLQAGPPLGVRPLTAALPGATVGPRLDEAGVTLDDNLRLS
ncbi:MAG TPA: hypothetical protein PKA64_20490, partial [Myxococcota bacterium]|nr:hypothetical protein [Myxococcota bacterium]